MENKIQELTDKIYREGVEKGNEEAQRLIANAQEEAKKIIEDAVPEDPELHAVSARVNARAVAVSFIRRFLIIDKSSLI